MSFPTGICAIYNIEGSNPGKVYYTFTDHLGSLTELVDASNNYVTRQSFDAWGNKRSVSDWRNPATYSLFAGRGYTGHEHLEVFNLINMNGRVYDPVLGRFLSPDPYVQMPDFSQSFNRYSYCLNNPLVYTDPDGEFPWLIAGLAIIGSYLGGVGSNEGELNPLQWDWKAPETYLGIGFGGLFGYYGGYGLMNPGSINLAVAIGTPIGGVAFVGNQSDWSFQWTTVAGGGGEVDLDGKQETKQINLSVEKPKWDGPYYQGTKEEAKEMLLSLSKMFNVETSYWSTSRGYYFEPIQGNAYGYSYDQTTLTMIDYNVSVGYRSNTIKSTYRYTYVENIEGSLFLSPNVFQRSKVYNYAHTHPKSSYPSESDRAFSSRMGIPSYVFGWNGNGYKIWNGIIYLIKGGR